MALEVSLDLLGGKDRQHRHEFLQRVCARPDPAGGSEDERLILEDRHVEVFGPVPDVRCQTGRHLVDEAHYCLGTGNAPLIDPELAGYILVMYRVSALDPSIRTTSDSVVMVTRETDLHETETLIRMCRPQPSPDAQPHAFADLGIGEAALLPGPEESHGRVRRFQDLVGGAGAPPVGIQQR